MGNKDLNNNIKMLESEHRKMKKKASIIAQNSLKESQSSNTKKESKNGAKTSGEGRKLLRKFDSSKRSNSHDSVKSRSKSKMKLKIAANNIKPGEATPQGSVEDALLIKQILSKKGKDASLRLCDPSKVKVDLSEIE